MDNGWVLISGASTGIGRASALLLVSRGFHVLAGVRSASAGERLLERAAAIKTASVGKLLPVLMDVTSIASIAGAVAEAKELAGDSGLYALINNAGIVVPGPVEHISAEDWHRQFDVNFFGLIELTRAALPLLRQGVAAHGPGVPRLLLVSSIGGRVAQPFIAPYTSSKFAVTALGDSLRLELRRQGIGVTVIEPGAVATDIWGKGDVSAQEFSAEHPARKLYGAQLDGLAAAARKTGARGISGEKAAAAILASLTAKRAPARVLVGADAKIMAVLKKWLPASILDALLVREFGA